MAPLSLQTSGVQHLTWLVPHLSPPPFPHGLDCRSRGFKSLICSTPFPVSLSIREGEMCFSFLFSARFFVVLCTVTEMSLAECSLISQAIDFAQGCFVSLFFFLLSLFKVFCHECVWEYRFFFHRMDLKTVEMGMSSQVHAWFWGGGGVFGGATKSNR